MNRSVPSFVRSLNPFDIAAAIRYYNHMEAYQKRVATCQPPDDAELPREKQLELLEARRAMLEEEMEWVEGKMRELMV